MPLQDLLDQEHGEFQRHTNRWQPTELLPVARTRLVLQDLRSRYQRLLDHEAEFKTAVRAERFLTDIRTLRFCLREAHLFWRADQLRFLTAMARFYNAYGRILFWLHQERPVPPVSNSPQGP